ncbi:hypothetical protein Clacol_004612 [Clathrus columnatus]|uniref:Ubiquitin-like domain-containing protein n=1 Tax=Clathrus columnatus TaxID=1419009 RepID=A0AAV5AD18_9AGAM|nr:hypothetical protein Clacol_004612 [Clathrus columnatus]
MVHVAIDSYKDKDSLAIYELAEGSSIIDLKAEIEATENIPVGHQRLVYKEQELKDSEGVDPLKTVIYLLKARIYLYLKQQREASDNERLIKRQEDEIIDISVDLEEPVRSLSKLIQRDGKTINTSTAKLFVLDSDKQPIVNISDVNQSFSSYGVCNGNIIDVVYESWTAAETDFDRLFGFPHSHGETLRKVVRAKYDWDGEIKHPIIKGLPLKRNDLFNAITVSDGFVPPGWLYGSGIHQPEPKSTWLLFSFFRRGKEKEKDTNTFQGFFPESFTVADTKEDLESSDLKIPPLPPFQFPPATGMIFHMPFSDNGHSFLKLTVHYELLSGPTDTTRVTMKLLCSTNDTRRISSVGMFITIPYCNEISDVQVCDNEAHRKEIQTDKQVTDNQSKETHFDGINIGAHGVTVGLQGGVSRKRSISDTEKGLKISQRKVEAGVLKEGTIFWNLKAPMTKLDDDGLTGEESITFTLTKKPVEFKYDCRVTHSRNGVEKIAQRVSKT